MRLNPERPLLLGHRGVPSLAPENTIDGFHAALDGGFDGIELDIQRTSDGVLAVHHDSTTKDLVIADMTWRELKAARPLIPRLEQVFELFEGYPCAYLNIELKSEFAKTDHREADLIQALQRWSHSAKGRTWVSCFDPLALIRLHRLDIEPPLALLASVEEVLELIPALPVSGIHIHHKLFTPQRLHAWQAEKMFVFVWTVNDQMKAKELMQQGADGLIGDTPELLFEVTPVQQVSHVAQVALEGVVIT